MRQPGHLERLIQRLRSSFTKEGILKARAIEDHLDDETRLSSEFDLLPQLGRLNIPTLVIHGDDDQIVPIKASAEKSAKIVKGAQLKVYPGFPHGMCATNPEQMASLEVRSVDTKTRFQPDVLEKTRRQR